MRNVFIHCGPHKTGSTTIQRALRTRHQSLRQYGYLVPDLRQGDEQITVSHKLLVADLKTHHRDLEMAPAWCRLSEILEHSSETVVLSRESFSTQLLNKRKVTAIVDYFERRGIHTTFVALIRDQPAWINSHYVQATQRIVTSLSFEAYLDAALADKQFNYSRLFRHVLTDRRCSFTARPFELAVREGLLSTFCEMTEIPDEWLHGFDQRTASNPNPGARSVYVGREITRACELAGSSRRTKDDVARRLRSYRHRRRWHRSPYIGLTDQLAARAAAHFLRSNNRFSRKIWGNDWRDNFPIRTFERREFDPLKGSWLDKIEVGWLLRRLNRAIDDAAEEPD